MIDSDFSLHSKEEDTHKSNSLKEEDRKCYPIKASNQMPYQKIESQIRKDTDWPPISRVPPADHHNSAPIVTTTNRVSGEPDPATSKVKTPFNNITNNNAAQIEMNTYNEKPVILNENLQAELKYAIQRNRNSKMRKGSETSDQVTTF